MKPKYVLNTKILNFLIAATISLFVIFPDITLLKGRQSQSERPPIGREYNDNENQPQQSLEGRLRPPPGAPVSGERYQMRQDKWFQIFPYNSADRIVANYVFFFLLSIVLLYLNTYCLIYDKSKRKKNTALLASIGGSLMVCILFSALYTLIDRRPSIVPLDGMNVFKVFFVGLVAYLFVYVMYLIKQQQKMALENEKLKSENILAQYNMLVGQINPHFFFNSLNSLSALIREEKNEKSLKYINELSDIFRYVLKSNKQGLTPLKEELNFLKTYRYMMEIRYEGKLHFNINIDGKYLSYQIPSLSTQLLLENAIKHNEISDDNPLTVSIYSTPDNELVIANPIHKKIIIANESGVGLQNLNNRYQLLTNKSITIINDGKTFMVRLPLTYTSHEL